MDPLPEPWYGDFDDGDDEVTPPDPENDSFHGIDDDEESSPIGEDDL